MKGGKVMEEEKRRMEEEMIAELPSALINHCLWNDQREDGGGEQGGRMEKERCLLQREINDNGTERDGCWNQILISFHTFFSHNFCLSVCIFLSLFISFYSMSFILQSGLGGSETCVAVPRPST